MIIRRLTLNDFLSHESTTVEFPWGVTVFMGPNGAGKTSIIDGIFVALFNHRPRGNNWRDVVRRGSDGCRVELEFEESGVPYRVVWERKKTGPPTYRLYRADREVLIAEGVREVTSQLEATIGLDRDSAINSILIRQGEITALLDKAPAERKRIIGRLVGIDRLETAWRNMASLIDHFRNRLRRYERYQFEHEHILRRLKELDTERQRLEKEINEISGQLASLEGQLKNETQLLEELEGKKEKHQSLSEDIRSLRIRLEAVSNNLDNARKDLENALAAEKRAKDLLPLVSRLDALEELHKVMGELGHLEERKKVLLDELSRIREAEDSIERNKPLHEEYLRVESEVSSLEGAISRLQHRREDVARMEEEREHLIEELKKRKMKLQKVSEGLGEHPLVQPDVVAALTSKSPDELENEVAGLRAKLEATLSRLRQLEVEYREAEEAGKKMEELRPLVEKLDLLKELRGLDVEVSKVNHEIDAVRERLSKINELRAALERLRPGYEEYPRLEEELSRIQEAMDGVSARIEELKRLEVKLQEREAQVKELTVEIEELEGEILKLLPEPTIEAKEARLRELTGRIDEVRGKLKEYQDEIAKLKGRIGEINEYMSLLEGSNVCPVCHREMDEGHRIRVREEFLDERAEKEREITRLEALVSELQGELTELEGLRLSIERADVAKYRDLKEQLNRLLKTASELRDRIKEKDEHEKRLMDLKEDFRRKTERRKEVEADYHHYLVVKGELDGIMGESPEDELRGQLSKLESKISELEGRRAGIIHAIGEEPRDVDSEIKELEKVREEYIALKASAEKLRKLEGDIRSTKEEADNIREVEVPARLLAEKVVLEGEVRGLTERLKHMEEELEEARRDVEELARIEGRREELKAKLGELREPHEKYVASVEALRKERPKGEVLRDVEGVSREISTFEGKRSDLLARLGEVPEDLESEISRLKKAQEEYIRASEEAKKVESLRGQVASLETDLTRLKSAIDSKKSELEALGFSEEDLRKAQKRVRTLENEIKRLNGRKAVKDENLKYTIEKAKEAEGKRRELEEELKKVERLQNFVSELEGIRAAFHKDGVQRLLRRKVAPIISELATEYVESFNMDITDVYLNEDFDITVVKNSTEVPISTLSGGEKVAVALALRLAIARALSRNLSMVVMDEPTTHLDDERRRNLVDILNRFFKAEGAIPQVVIVTHHQELETVADTLYTVRKVNGVSQVSGQ